MKKFSREQIESRIKSMIVEITGYDEALLTPQTQITTLGENSDNIISIASLELAELLITIDEEFHVNVPDALIIKLNTIEALVDYITQHTQ